MKINKIFAIMFGLISVAAQGYFWEDFRQPSTPEQIEKRQLDLKYQEKQSRVQQKKANVAAEARKKQEDLNYQRSQLELQRKKDRLKLDR